MARNKLSETRCKALPQGMHSDGDGLFLVKRSPSEQASLQERARGEPGKRAS